MRLLDSNLSFVNEIDFGDMKLINIADQIRSHKQQEMKHDGFLLPVTPVEGSRRRGSRRRKEQES